MAAENQQTDEEERFARWGREHGHAVRGYLLAMVRRADVADDLSQEVFLRAWQARGRYREQGAARAYLLRIADRLVCDRGRKVGRQTNLSGEAWNQVEPTGCTEEPSQTLIRQEAAQRLTAALDLLSTEQRRVLLLRYYGQLSFAEIAETVGCPLNTALSHCRRGLTALRELLVEKKL
jgi:RNA polymerase sigma factor (sigma-70 family)